ncbi:MAG: Holliday junction branch migration protein RuvA [Bacteroidetes bacterium]|nr:Holliday junction branch migration protein RuvA [Bacteroidota bacterium]
MIAYLNGKIVYKSPTHVIMDVGGIGYMVKISLHTYAQVQNLDQTLLHISLVVKSENQSVSGFDMYGFSTELEKDIFEKLISVSGVGAATARMMLSSFRPEEVQHAILTENEAMIQSVKGIGPKSAKRLILELKDKIGKVSGDVLISPRSHNTNRDEALNALMALGFTKAAVEKVLTKVSAGDPSLSVEGMIKESLKQL